MNVAWALFWGGNRSTKTSVFPCKVAAADDERYLVCCMGYVFLRQCGPRGQTPWLSDLATSGGLQSISNCWISMRSAPWALLRQLRMLVCYRAPTLETCSNAKWKRKGIWSRKTWGLTLASKKWQLSSIAWRLHCTSTTRCKIHGASRADEVSQPRSAGILVWVTSNMDSVLVVSKPWRLFARNKTIPWQNNAALPWQMMVCTLRPCCWVLTEQVQNVVFRKQMQLGSAMIHCG